MSYSFHPNSLLNRLIKLNEEFEQFERYDFETSRVNAIESIQLRQPSYEDLVKEAANSSTLEEQITMAFELQKEMHDILEESLEHIMSLLQEHITAQSKRIERVDNFGLEKLQEAIQIGAILGTKSDRKKRAIAASNSRHDKTGGSREKRNQIRQIWSSGKYSSRDICAEQECAALEMSFSTARKALRNTPDPL